MARAPWKSGKLGRGPSAPGGAPSRPATTSPPGNFSQPFPARSKTAGIEPVRNLACRHSRQAICQVVTESKLDSMHRSCRSLIEKGRAVRWAGDGHPRFHRLASCQNPRAVVNPPQMSVVSGQNIRRSPLMETSRLRPSCFHHLRDWSPLAPVQGRRPDTLIAGADKPRFALSDRTQGPKGRHNQSVPHASDSSAVVSARQASVIPLRRRAGRHGGQ